MSDKPDLPSQTFSTFKLYCRQVFVIVEMDLRKLWHDPNELLTRLAQPLIWLLIFGQAMAATKAIPTGEHSYLDFIAPGILAQSILMISIFFGIALIWERDMGILQKIVVSPAPRSVLVLGRGLAAGIRGIPQAVMIYLLALFLGIRVRWDPLGIVGVLITVLIGGALFSTFSLCIASILKKRERFMGIGQVLTLPLFFASNALYPIEMMPPWLQHISRVNPLTYQVDALRHFMTGNASSYSTLATDFAVMAFALLICILIGTKLYPKILY